MTAAAASAVAASGRSHASGAVARGMAMISIVAAVYAAFHPYLGIIGDSSLYLGRSLADLDPSGVGRDIVFVFDGQSHFSIFARIADPLVGALGVARTSILVAIAASICVFAATLALARALVDDRRLTFAIALVAATMPTAYGDAVFHFAETSAVPRPFAEAAVLAMLAALLAGRPLVAALFLLAALLLHPIMAMAGVGTVLVLLAWRRGPWASLGLVAAFAAAAALVSALGATGVPPFDRLVARIDPDWLGMLTERSPHLFPSLWHVTAFAAPLAQLTTIALAARRGPSARRRVLVAVAISAVVQLTAAVLLGDALHGLLAIQVQGWRALWLLAVVGSLCLPIVAYDLWCAGAKARLVLALVGMAWLCPLGLPGTCLVCCLALALHARAVTFPVKDKHAIWALTAVGAIAIVDAAIKAILWAGFVGEAPHGVAVGALSALVSDLLVTPAWLAIAVWLLVGRLRTSLAVSVAAALALSAVAASIWDEADPAAALAGRQDRFAAGGVVPGARSSEVMVVGGVSSAWFALGRPQYVSPEQAVSIVFSRPLAMEWRLRARALAALGLVPHNIFRPWDPMVADDHIVVTAAKLSALCRRDDAPAAVIVPDRDDAPAPELPNATRWTAAPPQRILENYQPPQWHAIHGWVAAPCSALRAAGTLAKSGVR